MFLYVNIINYSDDTKRVEKYKETEKKYRNINSDKYREFNKKYREAHPPCKEYRKQKLREYRAKLSDSYIVAVLKQNTNMSRQEIKQFPQLIDFKRKELKIKRLIKQKS